MKNGDGFILVYSIISRATFNDMPDLRQQILNVKDKDDVPMVLVGNKCDMESHRQVSRDEGAKLAQKWGPLASFYETSAKNNIYVSDVFKDLAARILEGRDEDGKGKKKRSAGKSKQCTLF